MKLLSLMTTIVSENLSNERLRDIEKGLNLHTLLKIEGIEIENLKRKSPKSGLKRIFELLSTRSTLVASTNELQCIKAKRRSSGDMYRIMKYYYPNVTFKEVRSLLFGMLNDKTLSSAYCHNIQKRVFYKVKDAYMNLGTSGRIYYKDHKDILGESFGSECTQDEYKGYLTIKNINN
jgi:hypothetical protein